MRLTAIFIEDDEYRNGGYTINFGGNNFYSITLNKGVCDIKWKKNDLFIENFFDPTRKLTNVSAIVGSNGSGKTTLIYDIIKLLNESFISGFTIWEDNDNCYFNKYRWSTVKLVTNGLDFENLNKELDTIYFSPYLDHKIPASGIDISADRYLREDLQNINDTFEATDAVVISDRLKRSDYKRFINFQQSKFSEAIREQYGVLDEDLYKVVFTRHKINATEKGIDFHNTPWDFRGYLDQLYLEIRKEYSEFNRYVSLEEERNNLHKKLYKNLILMDVFCLLIKLMEQSNIYLQEGHFEDKFDIVEIIGSKENAYYKLKFWLSNYYYSKGVKQPLPNQEVLNILDFLFKYIDSLPYSKEFNYLDWESKALYFDEKNLDELLDLNEQLLAALPKYYLEKEKDSQFVYTSVSHLQYFVNLEYASRQLSSGETAMLHLYSRLYDYFSRHILNVQIIPKKNYYVLFLDEADMAYHPSWKRSYIKSVIDFTVDFFNELGAKVQIIFTTHDPLSLSDIPNSNVIYMHKDSPERILKYNDDNRPTASFAANVNDLLGHSFFLEDLLIGDFARGKIEEVIKWINVNKKLGNDYNREEIVTIKKIIAQIEEPVLRNKLTEMISEIEVDEGFVNSMIEKHTAQLRALLKDKR